MLCGLSEQRKSEDGWTGGIIITGHTVGKSRILIFETHSWIPIMPYTFIYAPGFEGLIVYLSDCTVLAFSFAIYL